MPFSFLESYTSHKIKAAEGHPLTNTQSFKKGNPSKASFFSLSPRKVTKIWCLFKQVRKSAFKQPVSCHPCNSSSSDFLASISIFIAVGWGRPFAAGGAEATLLDHCIIPWPYRRIPSEWALETNLAYISLGENYGIGFSTPSKRASAAASEALFPSGLGGKRPRQLARGLLAFSRKMALASMAESKTTICVLVVTVLLGIGCLIGKKTCKNSI